MGWTIEGTIRYLSEFGLKPERSRISTEDGDIYLSDLRQVNPNNMMDSNCYAYYIYTQQEQIKALLITTSTDEKKYQKDAEVMFIRLVNSLVKQTTTGTTSHDIKLEDNYKQTIGEHVLQIEKNSIHHSNSLRCILSRQEDAHLAKLWVNKIDYRAD